MRVGDEAEAPALALPLERYALALAAARDAPAAPATSAQAGQGALEVRRGGLKLLMALVAVVPDLFGSHLPPASGVQLVRALRSIESMDSSAELRSLASALVKTLEESK